MFKKCLIIHYRVVSLIKKDDIKKLNNLTANYYRLFYKDRANDVDVAASNILAEGQPLTDDIKKHFVRNKRVC